MKRADKPVVVLAKSANVLFTDIKKPATQVCLIVPHKFFFFFFFGNEAFEILIP